MDYNAGKDFWCHKKREKKRMFRNEKSFFYVTRSEKNVSDVEDITKETGKGDSLWVRCSLHERESPGYQT